MPFVVEKIKAEKEIFFNFFHDYLKTGLNDIVNKMDSLLGFWTAPLGEMEIHMKSLAETFPGIFGNILVVFLLLRSSDGLSRKQC